MSPLLLRDFFAPLTLLSDKLERLLEEKYFSSLIFVVKVRKMEHERVLYPGYLRESMVSVMKNMMSCNYKIRIT